MFRLSKNTVKQIKLIFECLHFSVRHLPASLGLSATNSNENTGQKINQDYNSHENIALIQTFETLKKIH